MNRSESIKELATALAAFQVEVEHIEKDGVNPHFKSKFATLDNIINTIKPALNKNGLSFAQFPDGAGLTTILMHTSGEWMAATSDLVMEKSTPQGQGSALTYLRRYALSGALGLSTETDDDAEVAEKPVAKPVKPAIVQKQQDNAVAMKAEIAKRLNERNNGKLKTKQDYEDACITMTGLTLTEGNYAAILEVINK